jgi:hypothetical protein
MGTFCRISLEIRCSGIGGEEMVLGDSVVIAIQGDGRDVGLILVEHIPANTFGSVAATRLKGSIELGTICRVEVVEGNLIVCTIDWNSTLHLRIINITRDSSVFVSDFEGKLSRGVGCIEVMKAHFTKYVCNSKMRSEDIG